MSVRRAVFALALLCAIAATSCSALVAAYLVRELLNDQAPKKTWSGHVYDQSDNPVGGVTVEVQGRVDSDTDVAKFSDVTDSNGFFSIRYRWNGNVQYTIVVMAGGVELASRDFGSVEQSDRTTDLKIEGAVNVELSGVVRDGAGQPLSDVVIVAASTNSLDGETTEFRDGNNKIVYDVTNDAGVFTLTGTVSKYGIVCAFHPDHGFAYAFDEDDDKNGSIGLDLVMGDRGKYNVSVQVVDGEGTPVVAPVLPPARQFRLRLQAPFNLSAEMDVAVQENGLFPALVTDPSSIHPAPETLTVQSTGVNGISLTNVLVDGSTYDLKLLNVGDDNAATALVVSDKPLALIQDSVVIVRVN